MKLTDILSSGCDVKTLSPSKYRPPPWCNNRPSRTRFGVDVRRRPSRVHRKGSRHKQAVSRTFSLPQKRTTHQPSRQLSDVAEGLHYLHSCDVVHGDLKGVRTLSKPRLTTMLIPAKPNILVDATGHARITDFGLATITQVPGRIQNPLDDYGHSPLWVAPEILDGRAAYSKETDVFSFAGVIIEVRCGSFTRDHYMTIVVRMDKGFHRWHSI